MPKESTEENFIIALSKKFHSYDKPLQESDDVMVTNYVHDWLQLYVTKVNISQEAGGRLNRGGRKVCKDCRQVCKCVQLPDKMNSTCSEQGQSTLLLNTKKFVSTTRILSILTRPRTMGTVLLSQLTWVQNFAAGGW